MMKVGTRLSNKSRQVQMTGMIQQQILPFLVLIVVAIHVASGFVQLSPIRTKTTNPRIERWSPAFATSINSTSTTTAVAVATTMTPSSNTKKKIIKRTYTNGKPKGPTQRSNSNNNNNNKRTPAHASPITKVAPSSPAHNNNSNSNPNKNNKKRSRSPKEDQFDWLHWVYNQWKDTSPGGLTDENVIKHMMIAIPKWSKRKSLESAKNAEELLNRLVQEAIAGNPRMRTNVTTTTESEGEENSSSTPSTLLTVSLFNGAMDAYGKIGNPAGVQRILRRMEGLRTSVNNGGNDNDGIGNDFSHLHPDEFSMSTLATAWAKSHSEEAAQKAEGIIQYMDLKGLAPNTITYNSVLHAIAVGNQCDRALRAEDIVKRMKRRHEEDGEDCQPDVYTYQSLIQSWSRTSLPGAPQKAEQILRFMDDEAASGKKNCQRLAPNAYCFTSKYHHYFLFLFSTRSIVKGVFDFDFDFEVS